MLWLTEPQPFVSFSDMATRVFEESNQNIYGALRDVGIYLHSHPRLDPGNLLDAEDEFRRLGSTLTREMALRFGAEVCVMWAVAAAIMASCPIEAPDVTNDDIAPETIRIWVNGFFAFAVAAANVSLVIKRPMDGPILDLSEFYAFTIASVRQESGLIAMKFFWHAHVRRRFPLRGFRLSR